MIKVDTSEVQNTYVRERGLDLYVLEARLRGNLILRETEYPFAPIEKSTYAYINMYVSTSLVYVRDHKIHLCVISYC